MRPVATARIALSTMLLCGLLAGAASAQVSFDRLRGATEEPENWLTYSGGYFSQRYSELDQVAPDNVDGLALQWVYQTPAAGPWQSSPVVVDGVMYLTQRPNDIVALDARTGRVFWIYRYPTPSDHRACCGSNNRGVAVLGDRVFMATLDAHVVALDAATGAELWDVEVADKHVAYSFTLAPLADRGTRYWSAPPAATRASAVSLPRWTPRQARRRGASTPFPAPASRATRRGSRARPIRRRTATRRRGSTAAARRG